MAAVTREGWLYVWSSAGADCQPQEWPKFQHDLHNTGAYGTDASPPAGVRQLTATWANGRATVSWKAPGDDGVCGTADHYVVKVSGGQKITVTPPKPAAAGTQQGFSLADPGRTVNSITVSAVDEAGNRGWPRLVKVG